MYYRKHVPNSLSGNVVTLTHIPSHLSFLERSVFFIATFGVAYESTFSFQVQADVLSLNIVDQNYVLVSELNSTAIIFFES
jgi:hypothetical protein